MNEETTPQQQQAEPPPEWPLIKNILDVFGLDAIAFVADWKAAQQQAEPVMINGLTEAETNATASVVGLTKQAEPVAWDKPSASFNEWWDSNYEDPANPFEKDSAAYWAWAGWQAALAQRPWVGLTEFQFAEIYNRWNDSNGSTPWGLYHAIEKALKAKNHG